MLFWVSGQTSYFLSFRQRMTCISLQLYHQIGLKKHIIFRTAHTFRQEGHSKEIYSLQPLHAIFPIIIN